MQPKISVIISTHARNCPDKYCSNQLKRALDSIVQQTYKNLEIIIIDDASQDGTQQILDEYKNNDLRIKIFRFEESCKGFTAIRYNFGVRQASGEFVAYMMDDDRWYSKALETLINPFLQDSSLEMTYAQGQPIDSATGKKMAVHGSPWSDAIYKINIVPNPAVLIKKSVFDKVGYADESAELRRCNDQELWARMRFFNIKVQFIPQVIVEGYVGNADSIGSTIPVNIAFFKKLLSQRYSKK